MKRILTMLMLTLFLAAVIAVMVVPAFAAVNRIGNSGKIDNGNKTIRTGQSNGNAQNGPCCPR